MRERLDTARMTLRAFVDADAEELHGIFSDPAHVIGDGPHTDISATRDWIRRRDLRRSEHRVVWYAARLHTDGSLVGTAGLTVARTAPDPEIGFEIRRSVQNQGLGREAASAVVAEGLRAGFAQVWATVRPWNTPSLRALDAVGFTLERVETDSRGELQFLVHMPAR